MLQFDLRTRKIFLKRTRCEGIKADDIRVDAIVTIFSRNMKITGYADAYTKNKLQTHMEK